MHPERARDIHAKAENLREKEQNFSDSIAFCEKAAFAYQEEGNYTGWSEVLLSKFISLKHMYLQSKDEGYKIYAKSTILASLDIAKLSKDESALILPNFHAGEYYFEFEKDYKKAKDHFEEAISIFELKRPETHQSEGVGLNFKVHLIAAKVLLGETNELEKLDDIGEAILSLDDLDDYTKKAWGSGAYMRKAALLFETKGDVYLAQKVLSRAKEIIGEDVVYKLRRDQISALEKKISN